MNRLFKNSIIVKNEAKSIWIALQFLLEEFYSSQYDDQTPCSELTSCHQQKIITISKHPFQICLLMPLACNKHSYILGVLAELSIW